jgi:hypothetical protein
MCPEGSGGAPTLRAVYLLLPQNLRVARVRVLSFGCVLGSGGLVVDRLSNLLPSPGTS